MRRVVLRIDKLMEKHGLNQGEFSEKVGIRPAAISQLSRNHVVRISIEHLDRIVNTFEIDDINEIIEIISD
ncbi:MULTISPECIES: helix-turn-helix domain-containing protein [Bacillus]|uniref:helix-turn-helix domain-containing protein n=1 Tax=Bacillus TaxID=1386 RepID=UPI000BA5145F|nr:MULTISPECIES: helix-turn-helix transcriptional regulator [Bacillus amyloliquefaciens group]MED3230291.1 helix-turn-helix transcriptional regulator [Bacillus velezensis]PAK29661.1 transcriptional regulator [Bacillus velezensis]TJZ71364.1 XRE family transcriptional regulator [Bacillus amyloliquefaciens]